MRCPGRTVKKMSVLTNVNARRNYVDTIIDNMRRKFHGFISLKEILLRAGFTMWEPAKDGEEEVKPDLDFTNLEKGTLINLLSK